MCGSGDLDAEVGEGNSSNGAMGSWRLYSLHIAAAAAIGVVETGDRRSGEWGCWSNFARNEAFRSIFTGRTDALSYNERSLSLLRRALGGLARTTTRTPLIFCGDTIDDIQAIRICVHGGGGPTGNVRVTLAAARGSRAR